MLEGKRAPMRAMAKVVFMVGIGGKLKLGGFFNYKIIDFKAYIAVC